MTTEIEDLEARVSQLEDDFSALTDRLADNNDLFLDLLHVLVDGDGRVVAETALTTTESGICTNPPPGCKRHNHEEEA